MRPNLVYVRRGSSTGEAAPPEILKMYEADSGRRSASVSIELLGPDGMDLPAKAEVRLVSFGNIDKLPDCVAAESIGPLGISLPSMRLVNRNYWRDLARYLQVQAAAVRIGFRLTNRSDFALNDCKLEVRVEAPEATLDAIRGSEIPEQPSDDDVYSSITGIRPLSETLADRAAGLKVLAKGNVAVFEARLPSLLPGEAAVPHDDLVLVPAGPGTMSIRCRLLAAGLAEPLLVERELEVSGESTTRTFEDLKRMGEEISRG